MGKIIDGFLRITHAVSRRSIDELVEFFTILSFFLVIACFSRVQIVGFVLKKFE